MSHENLKNRTKQFALSVIDLVESLPAGRTTAVIGNQLLRSGTSVGANYRSACRARSSADFIAKMGIVEEESDESAYWMELLIERKKVDPTAVAPVLKEANELLAISVASINTAKRNIVVAKPRRVAGGTPRSALRTPHSS